MPIYAPFGFRKSDSLSGEQYEQNPIKRTIYLRTTTVLTLLTEPVSRDICRDHIASVNDLLSTVLFQPKAVVSC